MGRFLRFTRLRATTAVWACDPASSGLAHILLVVSDLFCELIAFHFSCQKKKLKHRNSSISHSTRGSDVAKELTDRKNIKKEFTIVFYETQFIMIRDSKLFDRSRSATKWMNWHKDHSNRPSKDEFQRSKTVVSHIEQIGQECTDATSIRLPNCSHNQEPSPPRIRRKTCRTNSFSAMSKMAPFFLKSFLVKLGHVQKLVELMSSIHLNICGSSFRLQLIPICCYRRQGVNSTLHASLFLNQ